MKHVLLCGIRHLIPRLSGLICKIGKLINYYKYVIRIKQENTESI